MKGRNHRHVEAREQFNNIAACFSAVDPVFMLKRNHIEIRAVQQICGVGIVVEHFLPNLKTNRRRIIV
jgi:hypothetical protein